MPQVDHDVVLPREKIIAGAVKDADPSMPFTIITYDKKGKPLVASTHGGPVVDLQLDLAKKYITA